MEAVICISVFILLGLSFAYWYQSHAYKGDIHTSLLWRWQRTLGSVNNTVLAVLFLFMAKNSIFNRLFGFSSETVIQYHTLLGYLFLLLAFVHSMLFYKSSYDNDTLPYDFFSLPMIYPEGDVNNPVGDNFTIPGISFIMWFGYIVWGVLSYKSIRRNYYELFRYAHNFYYILLIGLLYHAISLWYQLLPGMFFLFVDRIIRLNNDTKIYKIKSVVKY